MASDGAEKGSVGQGTAEDPWVLSTPPGTSEYTMYKDDSSDLPRLVCTVGKTTLYYELRCLDDLAGDAARARRLGRAGVGR